MDNLIQKLWNLKHILYTRCQHPTAHVTMSSGSLAQHRCVCVYYFLQYLPLTTSQPIPSATTVTLILPIIPSVHSKQERQNSHPILKWALVGQVISSHKVLICALFCFYIFTASTCSFADKPVFPSNWLLSCHCLNQQREEKFSWMSCLQWTVDSKVLSCTEKTRNRI
jgi:hypothetical protein